MKLALAIVTALAALAAHAAPARAEDALTGNVLVWADATLYPDASSTIPGVKLATLDLGRDKDIGYVVPMKVVSTKGDFVEVVSPADTECAWWRLATPEGLDGIHLFVRRADLAPVLTKPFKATYKDGSSITLQPGVAVLDGKVAFNRGVVPVAIPDASIGMSYAPKKVSPVPKMTKKFLIDEATEVKLDGKAFTLGPWVAGAAKKKGDRMMVTIAARCMTAVISVPKKSVHAGVAINQAVEVPPPPKRSVVASGAERYYVPAGTKVTAEKSDFVVGTLTADRDVVKPKRGARACSEFVVTREDPFVESQHTLDTAQPIRTLKLCAAGDAVKVEKK